MTNKKIVPKSWIGREQVTIVTQDEELKSCLVIEEEEDYIRILTGDKDISIPRDKIKKIEKEATIPH